MFLQTGDDLPLQCSYEGSLCDNGIGGHCNLSGMIICHSSLPLYDIMIVCHSNVHFSTSLKIVLIFRPIIGFAQQYDDQNDRSLKKITF